LSAPFFNIIPGVLQAWIDNSEYSFNHRIDGSTHEPAPFATHVHDAKWAVLANQQLQSFNPVKNSPCAKDLSALDVSASKFRSLPGNDRGKGGTDLVDLRAIVSPVVRRFFNQNADFTADDPSHAIVFNMANFWQTNYSEMLGTMLHELVHLAHWDATDTHIQHELKIAENADDTTNISEKLAQDCFQE